MIERNAVERYPNAFGAKPVSEEYVAAHTALEQLPEAEMCCLQVLGPIRQGKFARQYNATPKQDHIRTLLQWARYHQYEVPPLPTYPPAPPCDDHGTIWWRDKTPLFYTTETYWQLGRAQVRQIEDYCDRFGLDFVIGPDSLWYPGATATVQYFVPGMRTLYR